MPQAGACSGIACSIAASRLWSAGFFPAFGTKEKEEMKLSRFRGSIPALVTPFAADGSVDEKAFRSFVEWQISEGSHGLVPVGTTGESPTLSHDEHKRVVEITVEMAKGRVPVIAGAGSNNTAEAIDLAKHAEKAGADAVLVVTPYYNKPNQRGMRAHFGAIADAISIPLFIYNIPGRSIIDMLPETMAALHKAHKNIVGVKDATANLGKASEQRHVCGPDFIQLSGEDITALGFNAHGGTGCISVTANVAPRLCAQFQEHCLAGRFADALKIQDKLAPLHKALFVEPSPGGAKYALSLLGKCTDITRSPLVSLEDSTKKLVRDAMVHAGLVN
jgi:4-hydroxy-tetrahydrodipicolinate synthase